MAWLLAIPRASLHAARRANAQHVPRLAAAIAFYALFSLPSLLVAAIDVAGVVFGEAAARERLVAQVARFGGDELASTLERVIAGAVAAGATGFLPRALALAALFFGASLTFFEVQHALNVVWGTENRRRWFVAVALKRLLSFAMVLLAGAILVASVATSMGIARFGAWLAERLPPKFALEIVRWLEPTVALGALALLFFLLFKVLPDGRVPWRRAWVGAVVTAVFLVAAKLLVGRYLGVVDLASVYGAAGSLVVLLVWVYASCLAILLGGAFAFAWEEVRRPPPAGVPPTGTPPVAAMGPS